MASIHHATMKKAKKAGIVLTIDSDGEIVASQGEQRLASHLSGSTALQLALDKLAAAATSAATLQAQEVAEEIAAGNTEIADPPAPPRKKRAAKKAPVKKKKSKTKKRKAAADDGDEDEEEEDEGRSVVKRQYKQRYRPFKDTCGDEVSKLISDHVFDDDKKQIDPVKLKRFAQANGVWDSRYDHLNVGMQRMNVANKLRGRIRREDYEIKWRG